MMLSATELKQAKAESMRLHGNLKEGDTVSIRWSVKNIQGTATAIVKLIEPLHARVKLTTSMRSAEGNELLPKGSELLMRTPDNKNNGWSQFRKIDSIERGKTSMEFGGTLTEEEPKGVSDGKGNVTHDGTDGGVTVGPSHANTGIPSVNIDTGQPLELEGQEGVLCKKVMTDEEEVTLTGTPKEIATKMQLKHGCNPMDTKPGSVAEKGGKTEGFDAIKEQFRHNMPDYMMAHLFKTDQRFIRKPIEIERISGGAFLLTNENRDELEINDLLDETTDEARSWRWIHENWDNLDVIGEKRRLYTYQKGGEIEKECMPCSNQPPKETRKKAILTAPVEQFMKNGGKVVANPQLATRNSQPATRNPQQIKVSAGFAIIYQNKILLAHPSSGRWYGTYSIPKGGIEKGESSWDAAIRETWEEIGIAIPTTSKLKNTMQSVEYKRESGKVYKRLDYFTLRITRLSEIGMVAEKIPKHDLQLQEVDWAGFVEFGEAKKRITKAQLPIIEAMEQENAKNGFEWMEIERKDIIAGDYIRAVSSNGKGIVEGTVRNLQVLRNAIPIKESKIEMPWDERTDYYKRYTTAAIKSNRINATKNKILKLSNLLQKSHA